MKEKINSSMSIEVLQGNAMDISMIEDKSYDIVLCFGPYMTVRYNRKILVGKASTHVYQRGKIKGQHVNHSKTLVYR